MSCVLNKKVVLNYKRLREIFYNFAIITKKYMKTYRCYTCKKLHLLDNASGGKHAWLRS